MDHGTLRVNVILDFVIFLFEMATEADKFFKLPVTSSVNGYHLLLLRSQPQNYFCWKGPLFAFDDDRSRYGTPGFLRSLLQSLDIDGATGIRPVWLSLGIQDIVWAVFNTIGLGTHLETQEYVAINIKQATLLSP